MKKGIKIGEKVVCDPEKLYGRLLVVSQKREISLENAFSFELAPLQSSLFDEYGLMRKSNKSSFASKMFSPYTGTIPVDIQIIDGNELIYHTLWPKVGTVAALLNNIECSAKQSFPVFLIFDNYNENSIKSYGRSRRSGGVSYPDFKLNINSPLPAREKIMKNCSNERILINLLCNYNSVENVNMIDEERNEFQHEEADVSIISYLFLLFNRHQLEHIHIKADDTDIFLLLLHY